MKTRPLSLPNALCMMATLFAGLSAHAQDIEPRRYINSQGVEMLLSRGSPHPAATLAEMATASSAILAGAPVAGPPASGQSAAAGTAAFAARANAPAAAQSNEKRIAPAQQAVRDEERERLLNLELVNEGSQLEIKRKALRGPRAEIDLDATQRAKLATDLQRHEENIRALMRELALLRPGQAPSRKQGANQPASVNLLR